MKTELGERVAELVELGWDPQAVTESSAALHTRGPFNWWLFLLVLVVFPVVGGVLYLVFWMATSRVTLFLRQEGDAVHVAGDAWLLDLQMARKEAVVQEQREIKERGFWPVMWPKLVAFLGLLLVWVLILRCAF